MDWGTAVLIAAFGIVVTLLVVVGCLVLAYLLIRRSVANPFRYLRDRRKAEARAVAAEERRKKEAEQAAKELEARLNQKRIRAAGQYDKMVMRVLSLLRDSRFPGDPLRRRSDERFVFSDDVGWSWGLGREEYTYQFGGPSDPSFHSAWRDKVCVTLVFDANNQPSGFTCHFDSSKEQCGLTKDELVAALRKLFP